jgi:hypothetical protein
LEKLKNLLWLTIVKDKEGILNRASKDVQVKRDFYKFDRLSQRESQLD